MLLADRILFIDAEALVIDKPAGLPVDEPKDGTLSVAAHLESLRFSFKRRPTPVHRLDRDTSGCLLLARSDRAHKRFQQAFEGQRHQQDLSCGARRCAGGRQRHGGTGAEEN